MRRYEGVRGPAVRPGLERRPTSYTRRSRANSTPCGWSRWLLSPFHLRGVVIRTSVGVHTALDAQVARHRHHRICSPDRLQVGMWRRTTGELLEVRRSALRSGASLPGNWRSICDRADLGPRGEQLSWARPHSDPLTPTNGTTAGRAFAYSSARATAAPRTTSDLLTTMIESPGQR